MGIQPFYGLMKGMVVKNPVICKAGEGVALGINPWIGMMVFVTICRSVEELAQKKHTLPEHEIYDCSPEKRPFLKGNESSSNHQFSGNMLVFRGVTCW